MQIWKPVGSGGSFGHSNEAVIPAYNETTLLFSYTRIINLSSYCDSQLQLD